MILVLLHYYNQLNGYHDIDNSCDNSVDDYHSTKFQCHPSLHQLASQLAY